MTRSVPDREQRLMRNGVLITLNNSFLIVNSHIFMNII